MYLPDNMSTEKMVPHPPLPPLFVTPYPEARGPCGNAPSPLPPVNVCRVVLVEVDPLTFSYVQRAVSRRAALNRRAKEHYFRGCSTRPQRRRWV